MNDEKSLDLTPIKAIAFPHLGGAGQQEGSKFFSPHSIRQVAIQGVRAITRGSTVGGAKRPSMAI